jgi:polar amino acid transport system substrate-binding protein
MKGIHRILLLALTVIVAASAAPRAQDVRQQLSSGSVIEEVKKRGVLRIGLSTFVPWSMHDKKGELIGFEIDVANRVAADMGVKAEFVPTAWDGIIPALLAGKFDVIFSSMSITDERKKKVAFTDMYYATPIVFGGQASNKSDDVSPAALKGKTIGTQSSTIHANYLEAYYKDSNIKLYPTQDEPNLDLVSGRIDYVVGDGLVEADFFEKKGNGCCRIISEIKRVPSIHGPGVGAAFRPDDTDLRDMFNKAIADLDADGTFKKLAGKYFKQDIRGKQLSN